MTIKEAAEALNRSENTIRNWIRAGRLEANLEHGMTGQAYNISEESVNKRRATETAAVVLQKVEPTMPTLELKRLISEVVQSTVGTMMQDIAEETRRQTIEEMRALHDESARADKEYRKEVQQAEKEYRETIQKKLDLLTEKKQSTWWIRFRRWSAEALARISKRIVP